MPQRKHGDSPTPQDPNAAFISTKPGELLASLHTRDSPRKGIKWMWSISQKQSDTGRQWQLQTVAVMLSQGQAHRKAGKARGRANMHQILETKQCKRNPSSGRKQIKFSRKLITFCRVKYCYQLRPYLVLGRSTDTASGNMSKLQTETVVHQLIFHYTEIKTRGLRGKTSLLSAHFLVILKVF